MHVPTGKICCEDGINYLKHLQCSNTRVTQDLRLSELGGNLQNTYCHVLIEQMGKPRPRDGKGLSKTSQWEIQNETSALVPACQVAFLSLVQKEREGPALQRMASAVPDKESHQSWL